MTTRNIQHAKTLASIASQVVESYRTPRRCFTGCGRMAYAITPDDRGVCAEHKIAYPEATTMPIDPSWQYTLPEEYQG